MDRNRKIMIGAGGGVLLLCVICACILGIGGYVYREDLMALLGLAPRQRVARMLPQETQFYMFTNPNIQGLPGYQNLKELYWDNPDIQALWDEFETEVAEEADITYEDDIKPWLGGEIVLAVPDFKSAIENSSETPALVIAAQTTDQEASGNFISKVLAQAEEDDQPFSDEVYQDVTLHRQQNEFTDETVLLATFDEFVMFSNSDTLIKEMIDRSQGNIDQPSLVDSGRFQKVTNELPSEAVFTTYFEITGLFDTILAESAVTLPAEQTQDLEAFEAMGMAGTLQSDGIQIDVVVTYNVEEMSERFKASLQQPASPNTILNDIPANAIFSYNAHNLNNIWQQTKQSFESNPDFQETLEDFEQEVGLSIEQDIFSWMTGEFAIIVLEATPPDEFTPPVGGYLLIGTDNVDNARSRVNKVMDVLAEQQMLPGPPQPQTISGAEMNVFTDFNDEIQGAYGFYNDYFLLAYLEDSVIAATSAAQNPLTGNSNFKAVQDRLPDQNYGYMYLDLELGRELVESQLSDFEREEYEETVRPFLEPIHALGVAASTAGVEEGITKGVFFILISE